MANQDQIRVLFLGDEGVGKTSIIITIASETFPRTVSKTYHPVIISPDLYMLPINNSTVLIDSSSAKEDEQMTDTEIEKANVIILVYDVNNLECIRRLRSHWIPRIIKINEKIPIILAGNKVDLRSSHDKHDLESLLTPYFLEFKQVEMGIECSAKCYMNFIDLIYCAQKAHLFPISPLFDSIQKTLKPEYERALRRIFRICDKDQDGFLNNYELCEFQNYVFNAELQKKHITALKEVLIHECEDYDENQAERGVNFEAFKTLQKILITKMKQQTCWTILRKFKYDDKLQIKQQLWDDGTVKDEDLDNCRNVELSKDASNYLKKIFDSNKSMQSGKLDEAGMDLIFSTTEWGLPWKVQIETHYENGVTFDIWIGLWQKFFSQNPKEAFKNLVYIGYCGQFKDAIIIYKDKKKDLLKESKRKVFNCYIIGHHSWSQFLDIFIHSDRDHGQGHHQNVRSVVNVVRDDKGYQRYLILNEIGEAEIENIIRNDSKFNRKCDVLLLMYDDQESRQYIENQAENFSKLIPKILVNIKRDNIIRDSNHDQSLLQLAQQLDIKLTKEVSAQDKNLKDLINTIMEIAVNPSQGLSKKGLEYIQQQSGGDSYWATSILLGVVIIGFGVLGLALMNQKPHNLWKSTQKQ